MFITSRSYKRQKDTQIKTPKFDGFTPDKLKLWKVNIHDDSDDLLNLILQGHNMFKVTSKIEKYFTEEPNEEHIHVPAFNDISIQDDSILIF